MAKNTLGTSFKKVLVNYLKTGHFLFSKTGQFYLANRPIPFTKPGYSLLGKPSLPFDKTHHFLLTAEFFPVAACCCANSCSWVRMTGSFISRSPWISGKI